MGSVLRATADKETCGSYAMSPVLLNVTGPAAPGLLLSSEHGEGHPKSTSGLHRATYGKNTLFTHRPSGSAPACRHDIDAATQNANYLTQPKKPACIRCQTRTRFPGAGDGRTPQGRPKALGVLRLSPLSDSIRIAGNEISAVPVGTHGG